MASEADIVECLVRFLAGGGYAVRVEVPNMGQSADVVATKNRWVTFVEAKVDNWRRALEQCMAHELVADYVCIAIGTVQVSDDLLQEAQGRGYGLIHCSPHDHRCSWVLNPRRNRAVWRPQRAQLAKNMRRIPREC